MNHKQLFLIPHMKSYKQTNLTSTKPPQSTSTKMLHLKQQEFVRNQGKKTIQNTQKIQKEINFTHKLKLNTFQTQTPPFIFALNKKTKRDSLQLNLTR